MSPKVSVHLNSQQVERLEGHRCFSGQLPKGVSIPIGYPVEAIVSDVEAAVPIPVRVVAIQDGHYVFAHREDVTVI